MALQNAIRGLAGVHKVLVSVAAHAAATATELRPLFVAPFPCTITAVDIVPGAAVDTADTNTTHLNLIDTGSAGTGTDEVGNLDLVAATADLVANDLRSIPLNATYLTSGVAMAEGDVLALQFEKVGTGLLVPDSLFQLTVEPN